MVAKKKAVVLVVDDDKQWRHAMELLLKPHLVETVLVDSAERALLYLEKNQVDVLVTDTNMPGSSGIYLLQKVREKNKLMPIIVFFSGLVGSDLTIDDLMNMGATAVLEKGEAVIRLINILTLTHGSK